ncbi:HEPN domain-containing protein [Sphingomonas faeni]|uniref:HEPN domain-containing protein n=1 Tax=Sphingomonas faeni TaxID=185950 RepID=UPI003344AD33
MNKPMPRSPGLASALFRANAVHVIANPALDHLPATKRHELAAVVRILFAEFEDALAGRNAPHRKAGRILKIILFGSYARGDWVADPVGGYFSDYDLLVVVNHDELADVTEYWAQADDHLLREQTVTGRIRTPVNFVVHSLTDVNAQLRRGRPFFIDIARDGIPLYEAPDHPFDRPKRLSPEVALAEAKGYFAEWFDSAAVYAATAETLARQRRPKESAFLLHQAAERFYHCAALVLTLYSPKSHKLNFLRSQAERIAPALIEAWPRDTRFAQRCFELLRRAYVDARYSPQYKISDVELAWLVERVQTLQDLVRQVCQVRLAEQIS